MVVKAFAFVASVIVAGFMIANLLTAIPEQDKDLIFSTGALVSLEQIKEAFQWTQPPEQKFKWPYQTSRVWNIEKCTFQGEEVNMPAGDRILLFVVLGNKSDQMQAQPLLNSLHAYYQGVYKSTKPVCLQAHVFDFSEQPSAFSAEMIDEQTKWVAREITYLMGLELYKDARFSFITHSVGAYIAYNSLLQPKFPLEKLNNIFNLAAPLQDSPQKLTSVDNKLERIMEQLDYKLITHVAHFNISGGPRDLNVPASISSFQKAIDNATLKQSVFTSFDISTIKMKNVYQSVDHNSLLYSRILLNQIVPFFGQVLAMEGNPGVRVAKAASMLSFDMETVIEVNAEVDAELPTLEPTDDIKIISVGETLQLPQFNPKADDLIDDQVTYQVVLKTPLKTKIQVQTNIFRGINLSLFVKIQNKVVKKITQFEQFRMYEPLPYTRVNLDLSTDFLSTDTELVFVFTPCKDKDWAQTLMNYPAYQKSQLSFEYEPIQRKLKRAQHLYLKVVYLEETQKEKIANAQDMVLSSIVNSIIKDETLSVEFNISSDDLKLIIKHDRSTFMNTIIPLHICIGLPTSRVFLASHLVITVVDYLEKDEIRFDNYRSEVHHVDGLSPCFLYHPQESKLFLPGSQTFTKIQIEGDFTQLMMEKEQLEINDLLSSKIFDAMREGAEQEVEKVRVEKISISLKFDYSQLLHDTLVQNKWQIVYGVFTVFIFYWTIEAINEQFHPKTTTLSINLTILITLFQFCVTIEKPFEYLGIKPLFVFTVWLTATASFSYILITFFKVAIQLSRTTVLGRLNLSDKVYIQEAILLVSVVIYTDQIVEVFWWVGQGGAGRVPLLRVEMIVPMICLGEHIYLACVWSKVRVGQSLEKQRQLLIAVGLISTSLVGVWTVVNIPSTNCIQIFQTSILMAYMLCTWIQVNY